MVAGMYAHNKFGGNAYLRSRTARCVSRNPGLNPVIFEYSGSRCSEVDAFDREAEREKRILKRQDELVARLVKQIGQGKITNMMQLSKEKGRLASRLNCPCVKNKHIIGKLSREEADRLKRASIGPVAIETTGGACR